MKKYCYLLLLILSACTLNEFNPEEWAVDPILKLSASGVIFSSLDASYSFTYETNYKDVFISTNQPEWVSFDLDSSNKTINLSISANTQAEQRMAVVEVSIHRGAKSLSKELTIYQAGGKWDMVEGTDIKLRWSYDVSESQKEVIKNQIRELVYVEGGTFLMGTQNIDIKAPNYFRYDNESNPLHLVTLSDFYIGKYEVTQEQWAAVMPTKPSRFLGGRKPVENVKWKDAAEYVVQLSKLTGLSFSLPTSAQWEYAARGGKYSMNFSYPGSDNYSDVAHIISLNTPEESPLFTTWDVGSLLHNELGLYDMAGNVSEICYDWYGDIPREAQTDPTGPNNGKYHVIRGGDFTSGTLIEFEGNNGYQSQFFDLVDNNFSGIRIVLKY